MTPSYRLYTLPDRMRGNLGYLAYRMSIYGGFSPERRDPWLLYLAHRGLVVGVRLKGQKRWWWAITDDGQKFLLTPSTPA